MHTTEHNSVSHGSTLPLKEPILSGGYYCAPYCTPYKHRMCGTPNECLTLQCPQDPRCRPPAPSQKTPLLTAPAAPSTPLRQTGMISTPPLLLHAPPRFWFPGLRSSAEGSHGHGGGGQDYDETNSAGEAMGTKRKQ